MSSDDDDLEEELRVSPERRRLVVGAAALAGAAGLAGLRQFGQTSAATAASQKGRSGEALVVAFDGTTATKFVLDPHNSAFAPYGRVMRSLYDNLTVLRHDQTVGPWLAEELEISPDRRRYDFKLRPGVRFHDGTPFNAAAVKANFDRLANPKNALQSRRCLGPYAGSEIVGDDHVRVTLREPFTPLLRELSMTRLAMVSPTAVGKHGKVFGLHPTGTGPFRFVSLDPGTEIRLERNPDYEWAPPTAAHQGPPHINRLVFKNVPEESTRVAVLLNGQAHVADFIPPQNIASIKRDPRFQLIEKELLNTNYSLTLNVSRPPWDNEEARLAFRLALDIDTIVRVIYLSSLPRAWSSLSPSMFGSAEHDLAGSWRPEPARADEIFTRLGWARGPDGIRIKDGRRLSVVFIDVQGNREKRLDVIQLVRRQLAQVGVELNIDSRPGGSYLDIIKQNRYDLAGGAQYAPDPDVLSVYYDPSQQAAGTGLKVRDPELIALLRAAAQEPDGVRRTDLYDQAQRKINDKVYAIPIYVLLYNISATKRVAGLAIDAHGFPEFHGVTLDA